LIGDSVTNLAWEKDLINGEYPISNFETIKKKQYSATEKMVFLIKKEFCKTKVYPY
jgi:hypothetical protein